MAQARHKTSETTLSVSREVRDLIKSKKRGGESYCSLLERMHHACYKAGISFQCHRCDELVMVPDGMTEIPDHYQTEDDELICLMCVLSELKEREEESE